MIKLPRLLVLALLPLSLGAHAKVHETLDTGHYEARAQPGRSLAEAVNEASPFRPGDRIFHSATAWTLDWQVRPQSTADGRCRTEEVRIELRGEMLLPRLKGGSRWQQDRFESYLVRLREHELGHFEIGREAARHLEKQLYALAPARSCTQLQSAARAEGARVLAKYEAMGDAYDMQTEHGRTQGAWLVD